MSELSHQGAYRLIHQSRLTRAERAALSSHLRVCAVCRQHAAMAGVLKHDLVLEKSTLRPSPQFTAVYMESAARRSRRSQIMKPIYAAGGLAALALLVLAGWFITRPNLQTPPVAIRPIELPESISEDTTEKDLAAATADEQLVSAVTAGDAAAVERILDGGADPDAVDSNGNALLSLVTRSGQLEIVQVLLKAGADPNQQAKDGRTPLHIAANLGSLKYAQAILDGGANVDVPDNEGVTPMMEAIDRGRIQSIKVILTLFLKNGADPNWQDNSGNTPLHHAVQAGMLDAFPILLEHGASLELNNNDGQTALDIATYETTAEALRTAAAKAAEPETVRSEADNQLIEAVSAGDAAAVKQLLEGRASANTFDSDGNALLPLAAKDGQLEVVQLLVDAGADVNGTHSDADAREETGLSRAAINNHIDVVKLLIAHGADVNQAETSYNRAPLHGAAWTNNAEIVKILLESGADPNPHSTYGDGETPLHFAARNGSEEAVQALLDGGAGANSRTNSGITPMMMVLFNSEMLTLLLEGGVDPDAQDNLGITALDKASRSGIENAVLILIAHGASVDIQDAKGRTPLIHLLSVSRHTIAMTQVAELLLDAGADPNRQDEVGNSGLHYAASRGIDEAIPLLIERGASLELKNDAGETAVDLATNDEISAMLAGPSDTLPEFMVTQQEDIVGEWIRSEGHEMDIRSSGTLQSIFEGRLYGMATYYFEGDQLVIESDFCEKWVAAERTEFPCTATYTVFAIQDGDEIAGLRFELLNDPDTYRGKALSGDSWQRTVE